MKMLDRENFEKTYIQFSKNNQVTLAMKAKELELFERERFHGITRFGNSKAGIWFGPLLIYIDLEVQFEKYQYSPLFKVEAFDYFDRSGKEYLVNCVVNDNSKKEDNYFEWIFYPYNENNDYIKINNFASVSNPRITISSTEGKIERIKKDPQIILDFKTSISIDQMVNQISLLSGYSYDEEERLRVLYFLFIYFKKLDKAREILDKWNSDKRWMFFDPREKELLNNPDMYIEYVNEIKKMKKYSKLKEIEVKE